MMSPIGGQEHRARVQRVKPPFTAKTEPDLRIFRLFCGNTLWYVDNLTGWLTQYAVSRIVRGTYAVAVEFQRRGWHVISMAVRESLGRSFIYVY